MSTDDSKSNQISIKKEPGSDNQLPQSITLTTPIPVITTPIPVNTTSNLTTSNTANISTANVSITKIITPLTNTAPINQQTPIANNPNKPLVPPIKVITNQIYEPPSSNLTSFQLPALSKPPIAVNVSSNISNNKTTSPSPNLNNSSIPTNQLNKTPVTTNSFLSITSIARPTAPIANKPIAVIVQQPANNLTTNSSLTNNKTAVVPIQTNQTVTTTISSNLSNSITTSKESSSTSTNNTTTTTTNSTAQVNGTHGETSTTNDDKEKEKDKSSSVVVLNKQRLQELVAEIDTNEQLDEDVEDMLLNIADDFIDNLVSNACLLAKHRGSKNVEVKDVQLILEKNYNMYIPGFGSLPLNEEFKNVYKKSPATEAHKQRLALIKRTLMKKF